MVGDARVGDHELEAAGHLDEAPCRERDLGAPADVGWQHDVAAGQAGGHGLELLGVTREQADGRPAGR